MACWALVQGVPAFAQAEPAAATADTEQACSENDDIVVTGIGLDRLVTDLVGERLLHECFRTLPVPVPPTRSIFALGRQQRTDVELARQMLAAVLP
jgi:hypothetical protein